MNGYISVPKYGSAFGGQQDMMIKQNKTTQLCLQLQIVRTYFWGKESTYSMLSQQFFLSVPLVNSALVKIVRKTKNILKMVPISK